MTSKHARTLRGRDSLGKLLHAISVKRAKRAKRAKDDKYMKYNDFFQHTCSTLSTLHSRFSNDFEKSGLIAG